MIKLTSLSVQELRDLATSISAEQALRESIDSERAFIADRIQKLAQHAETMGEIPFEDRDFHLPEQVVSFDGALYRNVSGMCVTVAPGEPLTVWEELAPELEPEPEPEPEPEEPPSEEDE